MEFGLLTFLAFIAAILILVSLHEFGHYIVARLCGVKVLRFSVGFGKPFWMKKKGDTEWALAPIPLGGYVRMVDTREGDVAPEDLPFAFDKQHPAKRIAIVIAGPLMNLFLAVVFFAISFSIGVTELKPFVGTVVPSSMAARSGFLPGDEIQAVNGEVVQDWGEAHTKIVFALDSGNVQVRVKTLNGDVVQRTVDADKEKTAIKQLVRTGDTGMMPQRLTQNIGFIEPTGPAASAGLKVGDKLLKIDDQAFSDWFAFAKIFRQSPGKELVVAYERDGKVLSANLRPNSQDIKGELVGKVGIGPQADKAWLQKIELHYKPTMQEAVSMAYTKTWSYAWLTTKMFGRMVTGQASLEHISGPITIADIAGKTASLGLQPYLEFLALVSLSLGVLNFLPIPVLDGGHLLYYSIEWIRGKPLSKRIQEAGVRFGLVAMLLLMVVAFFNDISRFFG